MKTTIPERPFQPVTISITFETQKELDDFGSLCNSAAITDTMSLPHHSQLRALGANINGVNDLIDRIMSSSCMKYRYKKI